MVKIETIDELIVENPSPEEGPAPTVGQGAKPGVDFRAVDRVESADILNAVNEHGRLADLVASNLRMKSSEAQRMLKSYIERLNLVNSQLVKEVEMASMRAMNPAAWQGRDGQGPA